MGGTTSTHDDHRRCSIPSAPVLNAITGLADPAGETQIPLTWSQPAGGARGDAYSIEYSTSSSFPAGNFSVVTGLAPSITNYTVTSLTANTTYYFEIIAYAGTNSAVSNVQSFATLPVAVATCKLGQLNVTGATTLSTTGTILQNNGKMSEDLALSWTTTGTCHAHLRRQGGRPDQRRRPGLAVHVDRERRDLQRRPCRVVRLEELGDRPAHLHGLGHDDQQRDDGREDVQGLRERVGVVLNVARVARDARRRRAGLHDHRGDGRDGDPAHRARDGVRHAREPDAAARTARSGS